MKNIKVMYIWFVLLACSWSSAVGAALLSEEQQKHLIDDPEQIVEIIKVAPPASFSVLVVEAFEAVNASDESKREKSRLKAVITTYSWMAMYEVLESDDQQSKQEKTVEVFSLAVLKLSKKDLGIMTASLMLASGVDSPLVLKRFNEVLADNDELLDLVALASRNTVVFVTPRTGEEVIGIVARLLPAEPLRQPVLPTIWPGGSGDDEPIEKKEPAGKYSAQNQ